MIKSVDPILEPLLASPLLPRHVAELEALIAAERAKRKKFYEEMPEQQKVEFINGEVVMHSPAKVRHSKAVLNLSFLLQFHVSRHDLGMVGVEKCLVSLSRNDYEPDVLFYNQEKAARLTPDQMKLPAPDFITEFLSPGTERNDRGVKFEDYALNRVAEYWIVDPVAEAVEQYVLNEDALKPCYRQLGVWTGDAEITSVAVSGFHPPARALFERQANLAALAALS